jgi:hypothetical protein
VDRKNFKKQIAPRPHSCKYLQLGREVALIQDVDTAAQGMSFYRQNKNDNDFLPRLPETSTP